MRMSFIEGATQSRRGWNWRRPCLEETPKATMLDYRCSSVNGRLRLVQMPKNLDPKYEEVDGARALLIGSELGRISMLASFRI